MARDDVVWTDARKEQLRDLWNEGGRSAAQIAAVMGAGLTRNAVIGMARRMGLREKGFWTKRRVADLLRLRERHNAHEIATILGTSHQAVWSKLQRLKAQEDRKKAAFERNRTVRIKRLPPLPANHDPEDKDAAPYQGVGLPVSGKPCQWPIGEPSEHRACGRHAVIEHSYCEEHLCRSFARGMDGIRAIAKGMLHA